MLPRLSSPLGRGTSTKKHCRGVANLVPILPTLLLNTKPRDVRLGGHVYRGRFYSEILGGAYVFGDQQRKLVFIVSTDIRTTSMVLEHGKNCPTLCSCAFIGSTQVLRIVGHPYWATQW